MGWYSFSDIYLNSDDENYIQTKMFVLVSYVSSPRWPAWVTSPQHTEEITVWASFRNVIICLIFHCGLCLIVAYSSDMSYLLVVFSLGRWWVGLYHVWSTGNTGVFCRAAQVSQCGSLSKGVSNLSLQRSHFWSHDFCLLPGFATGKSANSQHILMLIAEEESSHFNICQE